jgi:DNA-binding response OmpR family regulator
MKKILLVEDNQEFAENIMDLLILSGYVACVAENGDKGQQSLSNYRPDLIISDVHMPGMNGLELLQLIRKDKNNAKLPIILLSAKTTDQDVENGKNAGANLYLKKPCDPDELVLSVSQLLR